MALDCVLTPPSLDQGNKDTKLQTEGENESDKPDDDEETDIDLEEGEILDSGEDEEVPISQQDGGPRKEPTPPPINYNQNQNEQSYRNNDKFNEDSDDDRRRKKKKRRGEEDDKKTKRSTKKGRYVDHDQLEDDDEDMAWNTQNASQNKRKLRREESPNDSNMSAHSDEDGKNFHDFRNRGGNSSSRNSRKGRGTTRRQRMSQERNNSKTRKRKGHDGKKFKNSNSGSGGGGGGGNNMRNNRGEKREPRPKQICKYYLDGKCHKKNDCQYSHDVSPLRKRDLCKFYLNGFCAKAETCLFMHEDFPCKYYHVNGNCNYESFCRFSHEPLTDETRMILERSMEGGTLEEENDNSECNPNTIKISRPSLLGSPPRHVREAAEEWQQDLIQRLSARDKKIDFGCHNAINLNNSPNKQQSQPFLRPGNFYVDTLQTTPPKNNMDMNRLNMDMGGGPMMGNMGNMPNMNMNMNMMGEMNGGSVMGGMNNMNCAGGLGDMNNMNCAGGLGDMNNMNCAGGIGDMNMGQGMGDMNMMGGLGDFNGQMNCNMNGPLNGPMNGPLNGPMNGPLNGPMNGPMNGALNGPMNGPMNGALNGPMNGPMNGPLNGPMNGPMNGPLNGPMNGPLNGPMNGPMNGPLNGPMNGPLNGPMNGPMNGPLNGPMNGPMNGPLNGPMNCPMNSPMNGGVPGLGSPMMNMNNNMNNNMNMPGMGGIGNSMMGNMNGPRMMNMGGPMGAPNFTMPFMNADLMNQDNRDNFTPPRNNQTTPVPTDDEDALEFDQFLNKGRPLQPGLMGPNVLPMNPVNNFYEDDDEDVVVAGGIDDQEDDQFSERILEVKKTAVMGSVEKGEVEDSESQSTIISQNQSQSPTQDENSSEAVSSKPPIAIPFHLPRRTRELFLRIQQHQKKAGSNPNPDGEGLSDSQEKDGEESNNSQLDKGDEKQNTAEEATTSSTKVAEKESEVKEDLKMDVPQDDYDEDYEDMDGDEDKKNWLSSDEDDEIGDQPLTDVLKKLQQMPPPPTVPNNPKSNTFSGTIDITKMLNNIRQHSTQLVNNPNNTNSNFTGNQNFWQNIFSTSSSSFPNNGPPPLISSVPGDKMGKGGLLPPPLRSQGTSLLGPPPLHLLQSKNSSLNKNLDPRDPRFRDAGAVSRLEKSVDLKKVPTARDPRLSSRDPRMPTNSKDEEPISTTSNSKVIINKNVTNCIKSPSPPPSKSKEKRPSLEGQDNDRKQAAGTSKYQLYTVTVSPLNYSSYLFATQNDKKLLNDPRLKKLLENTPTNALQKSISLPFPPDLSKATLQNSDANTPKSPTKNEPNITASKPQGNVAKAMQEIRNAATRNQLKRKDSTEVAKIEIASPQQDKEPVKDTPAEPLPPPPTPIPTPKPPTPMISHLPKNFTDPRLAMLHQITDPKRSRHLAIPKKSAKLQLPKPLNKEEDAKKTEEAAKGGSLNRKKSLDYASPLNAYPENESTGAYNSYNRRPTPVNRTNPKVQNETIPTDSLPITIPNSLLPSLPDPLSPIITTNSEIITNQSLKEVFKTIDPTASPFC